MIFFYQISAKNDWIVLSHDIDCWGKYACQTTNEIKLWHVSDGAEPWPAVILGVKIVKIPAFYPLDLQIYHNETNVG